MRRGGAACDDRAMGTASAQRLRRKQDGRLLAGVCSGAGAYLGLDPAVVRLAFVLLTVAGGAGVIVYGALWLVLRPDMPNGSRGAAPAGTAARLQLAAYAALAASLLLIIWLAGAGIAVWPLVAAALGAVVLWQQADARGEGRWAHARLGGPVVRVALGVALVGGGVAGFLATRGELAGARQGLAAAAAIVVGVATIAAPWVVRLAADRDAERRARVRADERSELAAQVHDGVLHTLTLIQRRADDPAQVRSLARSQERQLRSWLHSPGGEKAASLAAELAEAAGEVEDTQGIPVEVVCVGDCPRAQTAPGAKAAGNGMPPGVRAAVLAAREAMVNAARHSRAPQIAVFAEVEGGTVTIFVRDRGAGFSLDEIPSGRMGVKESIIGRMERVGGVARIRTAPGRGTEVELQVRCDG
jgi:signal transduction histidine kinase